MCNWVINYFNTRKNIFFIEEPYFTKEQKPISKVLNSYKNIRKEITNHLDLIDQEIVFSNLVYFNYFQRPAFNSGKSIIKTKLDQDIAFNNIKTLIKILKPDKIVFASKLAFNVFLESARNNNFETSVQFDFIPHASCSWWNRKSKNYGKHKTENRFRTGREKFVDLIAD